MKLFPFADWYFRCDVLTKSHKHLSRERWCSHWGVCHLYLCVRLLKCISSKMATSITALYLEQSKPFPINRFTPTSAVPKGGGLSANDWPCAAQVSRAARWMARPGRVTLWSGQSTAATQWLDRGPAPGRNIYALASLSLSRSTCPPSTAVGWAFIPGFHVSRAAAAVPLFWRKLSC